MTATVSAATAKTIEETRVRSTRAQMTPPTGTIMATELSSINPQDLPILNSADAARTQFAIRELSATEVIDLRHGKRVSIGEIQSPERSQVIAGFSPDGNLVAMLEISGKQLKSAVVFIEESE